MALTNGASKKANFYKYVAFQTSASQKARMGHLDQEENTITPLSHSSGTPLESLYEAIEVGEKNIIVGGDPIPRSQVKLLAPIYGRDVLAVGKNYAEHAIEFNASGYDSSDKNDQPTHPVIFTKRATSIIADGDDIFPHPGFTESVDYEGELGIIIGKAGFGVKEKDAMDYVWGYTIINDMTARERQRDHKQFYIGKSPDTFCPIGPVAVAKEHLPEVLQVQTHVNGEKRQNATTKDLIFSVPYLVMALSEGATLQVGDVIASGTPAGVGFGFKPPVWLKPGDVVKVSVTGLGTLTNKIGEPTSQNPTLARVQQTTYASKTNVEKSVGGAGAGLVSINGKPLYVREVQDGVLPALCIHGLGGTTDYFEPLFKSFPNYDFKLFDLEGHGVSPTSARSTLSIASFALDAAGVVAGSKELTVFAHSMGCLVALKLAIDNPGLVKNLILMGPPPSPLPEAASNATYERAKLVREKGMAGVVDGVVAAGTSRKTQDSSSLAVTAVRMSLMGQDPEGYAKACSALAASKNFELESEKVQAKTLIITGSDDKVSPQEVCLKLSQRLPHCEKVVVLPGVGHWHMFEDTSALCEAITKFLK